MVKTRHKTHIKHDRENEAKQLVLDKCCKDTTWTYESVHVIMMLLSFMNWRLFPKEMESVLKKRCLENIKKIRVTRWCYSWQTGNLLRILPWKTQSYDNKSGISYGCNIVKSIVELIMRMSRIQRYLTPSQCLLLANDLIEGTEIEK